MGTSCPRFEWQPPVNYPRIICEWAKDWNADLIAIGHKGLSELSEMVLGSVSNYVFHHAPCFVLVVPGSKIGNRPMQGQSVGKGQISLTA